MNRDKLPTAEWPDGPSPLTEAHTTIANLSSRLYSALEQNRADAEVIRQLQAERANKENQSRPTELERLLRAAQTDLEHEVLDDLMLRSGLRWQCDECGYFADEQETTCWECGTPRPGP